MAITAPVLERVHELEPAWRITVRSGLPESVLRARIRCPFEYRDEGIDFGLRMNPDLTVDVEATVADYHRIHQRFDDHVNERARWLSRSGCSVLLSNISYLSIAAAARADIPRIAMSPLNWADLYRHFAPDSAACRAVCRQMRAAYLEADKYLAPEPCMPAPHPDAEIIAPVAQTGRDQRRRILDAFHLGEDTRLVLLALGGREAGLAGEALPAVSGVCWLADRGVPEQRSDILAVQHTGLSFPDLLASSDLLVCKPGYGAFAEAASLARPVVCIRRPHWPEEPYLLHWLRQQVPVCEAPPRDPAALETAVTRMLAQPPGPGCAPAGVERCVQCLREALGGTPRVSGSAQAGSSTATRRCPPTSRSR